MGNDRATTKSPVPEARQKLAGGATTGQRPRNMSRALKGREKGTRGLAGSGGVWRGTSPRACARFSRPCRGAGRLGRFGSGGFTTG